ncbi:Gnk2-homologous domain, partial [Arabidopsis thaliana x Arabidopsis arenosa]
MSSFFSLITFLFLFSFLTSFRASAQDPYFLNHNCPNSTTYSSNSTYFTNLKTLLSSLSSPNASYSTGFQNATVGQAPDRVTGLFLCRGDLSPEVCRNCVAFSVNETLTRCPNQREAVFYYEECILRYSHKNILSTTTTNDGEFILSNPNNISPIQKQINQFTGLVSSNMNQAAIEAANRSRKFSTIKTELTELQTLYGLVQCTPDLSRENCMSCLTSSINRMPLSRIGARQFWPSCNSRYELYAFYNETAIATPPPPPPLRFPESTPPLTSPSLPGKSGNSNVLVVAIVVPIIVAVLLLIAGYCFFAKRAKKTYGTSPALDDDKTT